MKEKIEIQLEGKNRFTCSSIYGAKSREPLVRIQYKEFDVTILPQDARNLALNLLQCAEAASQDAFLVEYVAKVTNRTVEQCAGILLEFREWRLQRQR